MGSFVALMRSIREEAIGSKLSESLDAAALIGPNESIILGSERPITLNLGLLFIACNRVRRISLMPSAI